MNVSPVVTTRPTPVFELEDLAAMPCGCVSAAYRAAQWDVTLVSIEAKGPHCILTRHAVGQVVELADAEAEEDPDDREQSAIC